MRTYHEIFPQADGSWLARIYESDGAVKTLTGKAENLERAKRAADSAVRQWRSGEVSEVSAPVEKSPWWRFW